MGMKVGLIMKIIELILFALTTVISFFWTVNGILAIEEIPIGGFVLISIVVLVEMIKKWLTKLENYMYMGAGMWLSLEASIHLFCLHGAKEAPYVSILLFLAFVALLIDIVLTVLGKTSTNVDA